MATSPQQPYMSVEEYLQLDRSDLDGKWEYIDGYVYNLRDPQAMAGGSIAHARIALNMAKLLDAHFPDDPCHVYTSDVRVQLSASRYVYPDISVSCDPLDQQEEADTIYTPRLIVEVLSPSTEAYDRGKNFVYYQHCPSIEDYVLVNTARQAIEVYHREGNAWIYRLFEPGQQVELVNIGFCFGVEQLYERTNVPANNL